MGLNHISLDPYLSANHESVAAVDVFVGLDKQKNLG